MNIKYKIHTYMKMKKENRIYKHQQDQRSNSEQEFDVCLTYDVLQRY